jgi:hypothetical protein
MDDYNPFINGGLETAQQIPVTWVQTSMSKLNPPDGAKLYEK